MIRVFHRKCGQMSQMANLIWGFCLLCSVFLFQGCLKSTYYGVRETPENIPRTYGDIQLGEGSVAERWWEVYGDNALNEALEKALDNSLTLKATYFRILQSQTQIEQSKSGYWPTASFSAGAGYGGSVSAEENTHQPSFSMGLNVGYEIDIWGAVGAEARVNELGYYAAKDAAESAILSLTSNFVQAWFNVRYYRARRELITNLLALSEQYLELAKEHYKSGQATGMDVLEQEEQVRSMRVTLANLDMNEKLATHQLSQLAGGFEVIQVPEGLKGLPELPELSGIPSPEKLLERRPDIRSAYRSAQQMDARVVIALADRLPTLKLSTSLNLKSPSLIDLFSQLAWNLAANFAATLFDGFRGSAALTRAKLSFLESETSYGVTVMNAIYEVESALLKYQQSLLDLENSRIEMEQSAKLLETSQVYYIGGLLDYNRVLSMLRSHVNSSMAYLEAQNTVLKNQIAVFVAMGGTWMSDRVEKGEQNAREILENTEKGSRIEEGKEEK